MPRRYTKKTTRPPKAPVGAGLNWIRCIIENPDDECKEWPYSRSGSGYGASYYEGRVIGAHRLAYLLANGPIPEGLFVLHGKDRPCVSRACCNPMHLRLGTLQENAEDRMRDGTTKRGSEANRAKLTEAQVIEIRSRYASGETVRQLAALFGLTRGPVWSIVRRRTWCHVA